MSTYTWALIALAAFGLGAFVGSKNHEERWQIARAKDAILWKVNTVTGETYICLGVQGCRRVDNVDPQTLVDEPWKNDPIWQPSESPSKAR